LVYRGLPLGDLDRRLDDDAGAGASLPPAPEGVLGGLNALTPDDLPLALLFFPPERLPVSLSLGRSEYEL
jgi:hypothetical protein